MIIPYCSMIIPLLTSWAIWNLSREVQPSCGAKKSEFHNLYIYIYLWLKVWMPWMLMKYQGCNLLGQKNQLARVALSHIEATKMPFEEKILSNPKGGRKEKPYLLHKIIFVLTTGCCNHGTFGYSHAPLIKLGTSLKKLGHTGDFPKAVGPFLRFSPLAIFHASHQLDLFQQIRLEWETKRFPNGKPET